MPNAMREKIALPGLPLAWSKPKLSRLVGLRGAIASLRCIDRRSRSDFQRLPYRPGQLLRSRIVSSPRGIDEKLRPRQRAAELQSTRCTPALNLRMAEFDAGTFHIQQRVHQLFPVPLAP